VSTYRYLRLSIVVMVLALFVSVLIERFHVGCWQGSISAYYYTPAHAIFVGALVAIGVSLIAIKGSTDLEDVLLNVAGLLAPIVAFVPTTPPSGSCPSTAFVAEWQSTAVFITYDDCGCFADHVPPPPGLGVREPMVIVSPWVKRASTDSNV